MRKVLKALLVLLLLFATLTGCVPRMAPSTESADNAPISIETVMRAIKDQDFESLAGFDLNGQLLFETTSNKKDSVLLTSAQLDLFREQNGALIMHNHPSGSTFSALDLESEARRGTRRAVVVTSDDLYVLEPGWRGWGNPAKLSQTYESYTQFYAEEAQAMPHLDTQREIIIWVRHQALIATASEFGLKYMRLPIEDVFCFHGIDIVVAG